MLPVFKNYTLFFIDVVSFLFISTNGLAIYDVPEGHVPQAKVADLR